MNNFSYIPILKTNYSELKAVEYLRDDIKDCICPLFELTRSRATSVVPQGDIDRSMNNIKKQFGAVRPFILDVTSIDHLSNYQIEDLQLCRNNYANWTSFVIKQKEIFPNIIPTIIVNDSDYLSPSENQECMIEQVRTLCENFDYIAYRFPVAYGNIFLQDFTEFSHRGIDLRKIIFIIDNGFFNYLDHEKKFTKRVERINNTIKEVASYNLFSIVVASENFPQNPADALSVSLSSSNGYHSGDIPIGAVELFNRVGSSRIKYSDYATVFPEPTLQEGGRGWIPRIDLPTTDRIIFGRERRETNESYDRPYRNIALNICKRQEFKDISKEYSCWGIDKILESRDTPTGRSPSHWISVRINIHLTIQSQRQRKARDIVSR